MARFIPNYSDMVAPLQILTHKNHKWKWGEEQQEAFRQLKNSLAKTHTFSYYDMKLPTELVVDASPIGLGAVLTEKTETGINVIAYANRRLTDPETCYSQTETETLAVVWASVHFDLYLYEAEYTVVTDHKPLEGLLNNPQSKPTARLQRLCVRLQPYKMKVTYRPGWKNQADYLSRLPQKGEKTPQYKSWIDQQVEGVLVGALKTYDDGLSRDIVKDYSASDATLQKLIKVIADQNWKYVDEALKPYKHLKEELTIVDGLVLRGDRLVVPEKLQQTVVDIAHSSHHGIGKTKALLCETLWFPGMDRKVEHTVTRCLPCQEASHTPMMHEPLKMTDLPDRPWQKVSMDLCGPFSSGDYLLVVIDDCSRFPEVEIVRSTSGASNNTSFRCDICQIGSTRGSQV